MSEIVEFNEYDSGLLNDFGGGQVDWWWDYIRTEVWKANERGKVQFDYLLKRVEELKSTLKDSKRLCDIWVEKVGRARNRAEKAETSLSKLKKAAGEVRNWHFIFGGDNGSLKYHLDNLGSVLDEINLDELK